jgi:hypothetical protein
LANESLGITRLMQTEITLQNAGVDSKDSKLIMEREFGKLQAYQQLINMLMPLYENK